MQSEKHKQDQLAIKTIGLLLLIGSFIAWGSVSTNAQHFALINNCCLLSFAAGLIICCYALVKGIRIKENRAATIKFLLAVGGFLWFVYFFFSNMGFK